MKKNFSDYWETIEPWTIKTLLFTYIILKTTSEFLEILPVDKFMQHAEPIFIGALVLTIFLFIEKKLNYKNELETIFNFHADLPTFLKQKKYKEIKIYALNGHFYNRLLKDNNIEAAKLKVLLRKPDKKSILYPKEESNKKVFHSMMKNELLNFKTLSDEELVKNLEIKYYNSDSLLHFMVVDNKWMHFGLLEPIDGMPGSKVLESHFINNKYETGRKMIENFNSEFDTINEEYSEPIK